MFSDAKAQIRKAAVRLAGLRVQKVVRQPEGGAGPQLCLAGVTPGQTWVPSLQLGGKEGEKGIVRACAQEEG